MLFLVDANLPRSTVAVLSRLGHQVEFARDIGLAAAPDRDIAVRAKSTGAVLLTRDLDFANIRQYPPEDHAGIILFRTKREDKGTVLGLVERLIRLLESESPTGRLWVVEADRVRIRGA